MRSIVASFLALMLAPIAAMAGAPSTGLDSSGGGDLTTASGYTYPDPATGCIAVGDEATPSAKDNRLCPNTAAHFEQGVTTGDNSPTNSALVRENQSASGTLTCTAASDSFQIKDLNDAADTYAFAKCRSGTNVGRADLFQGQQFLSASVTVVDVVAATRLDDASVGTICLAPHGTAQSCASVISAIATDGGDAEFLGLTCYATAVAGAEEGDTFTATLQSRNAAAWNCDDCWTDRLVATFTAAAGGNVPLGETGFTYSGTSPVTVTPVTRFRVLVEEGTDTGGDEGVMTVGCTVSYAF